MDALILGFVSFPNQAEAERVGKLLLEQKLAACIQITKEVSSFYLWPPQSSKIESATEVLLLIKTLDSKWKKLEETILNNHSYKNPEILALSIAQVSQSYKEWLIKELEE